MGNSERSVYALKIDLTKKKVKKERLREDLVSKFIGGRGVNVKILFDNLEPSVDAYSPDNLLIFGVGPLVGIFPGAARLNVTAKSPLTVLGDSNAGGEWSPELRKAGIDYIVICGRSDEPVYLRIYDEDVQIKNARHLWGLETWESEQILKEDNDPKAKVASIGPAGENLVRFASIKFGHRTAGRCGLGAVMGSKLLKAIVVRGTSRLQPANPEAFIEATKQALQRFESSGLKSGLGGPIGGTYGRLWFRHNNASMMFTKHMRTGFWEEAAKLDPAIFFGRYKIKRIGCWGCPIRCTCYYEIGEGKYRGSFTKIEYGEIAPLSAGVGISDLDAALKLVQMADRFGMDTKSLGCVVGFAIELYEEGIINEQDIGFPLHWGDEENISKLIETIAFRQGFGSVLAEGEHRAAKIIGRGAEKYDLTVKYMEPHEPLRAQVGNALAQYLSTRGPDHLRGACHAERDLSPSEAKKFFGHESIADPLSYENKALAVVFFEHIAALADMLGLCKFFTQWGSMYRLDVKMMANLLTTARGIEYKDAELLMAAERVINTERAFIVKAGIRRCHDYPPRREFEEPFPNGPFKGVKLDRKKYDQMLDEYYKLRGWDPSSGVPNNSKLLELSLDDIAASLASCLQVSQQGREAEDTNPD
jgi:aldehyde:ferredoxin oxidoreductase